VNDSRGVRSSRKWVALRVFLASFAGVPLAGCTSMMASLGGAMPQQLAASGVAARAEVLEVWDTGWTINDNPVVGMKVRVMPNDRQPYEATIEKTMVSRIATWQFQPGTVIPVKFDPQNPSLVAVDYEGSTETKASTGNPYRDEFERVTQVGVGMLPPSGDPQVFLGTGDNAADVTALYENNFSLIGASGVEGGDDLGQAVEFGKEVGAAMVVLYGSFTPAEGSTLEILPYRRRPAKAGVAKASGAGGGVFSNLGNNGRVAVYWGKTRQPILGVVFRPANAGESARAGQGLVVEAVVDGTPAAAAGFATGDVVVAIDGENVGDPLAVPDRLKSLAGRSVRFDLLRGGEKLVLTAELNPAE